MTAMLSKPRLGSESVSVDESGAPTAEYTPEGDTTDVGKTKSDTTMLVGASMNSGCNVPIVLRVLTYTLYVPAERNVHST